MIEGEIRSDNGLVNEEEIGFMDTAKVILARFDNNEMKVTKLKMNSPLLTASILHDNKTRRRKSSFATSSVEGDTVYGTVACVVRGASIDKLIAYNMDWDSMFNLKHDFGKDTLEKKVLEKVNGHHVVIYRKGSLPPPFQCRDVVWSLVWEKQSSTHCICVFHPAHHKDRPPTSDTVRGESTRVFRFTEVKPKVTNFELVFRYVQVPRTTRHHTAWHPF